MPLLHCSMSPLIGGKVSLAPGHRPMLPVITQPEHNEIDEMGEIEQRGENKPEWGNQCNLRKPLRYSATILQLSEPGKKKAAEGKHP